MPAGRPTKYKPTFNKQAEKLSRLGATDEELADFFEIDVATLNRWKKKNEKFCASIKKGKLEADANVVDRLYARALGYKHKEVTFEKIDNKVNLSVTTDGEMMMDDTYKKKIVLKELAPDVTAQIYWLNNRRGKVDKGGQRWANKQEVTGPEGAPLQVVQLTAEEARKIAKALEDGY